MMELKSLFKTNKCKPWASKIFLFLLVLKVKLYLIIFMAMEVIKNYLQQKLH
jgi:hypothetical protein